MMNILKNTLYLKLFDEEFRCNMLKKLIKEIIWFLEGIIVGFGAIMPGISGGTLCVSFGMYMPLVGILSNPRHNIKRHGKILAPFIMGAGIGFVGLSGLAAGFFDKNGVMTTFLFIGLIIGTYPSLWKDAGRHGGNKNAYIGMVLGFLVIYTLLSIFKSNIHLKMGEGTVGFLIGGSLWGLSFIIPGLSSSTLLLFFGLYQPMLDGISAFDFKVLIPLAVGALVTVAALSKIINRLFERHYSVFSHVIIGVMSATVVMIFPNFAEFKADAVICGVLVAIGGTVAYVLTKICDMQRSAD